MLEATNFTVIPSKSTAGSGTGGFVSLSTDFQRSTCSGYERATARVRTLEAAEQGPAVAFVGALAALLFRHTQQDPIAIDLYSVDAGLTRPKRTPLQFKLGADYSVSTAAEQASTLMTLYKSAAISGAISKSNVAFVVVSRDAPDIELFSDGEPPDIYLVWHTAAQTLLTVYNARLFKIATVERFVDAFERVFAAARSQPAILIRNLPVLSSQDLYQITVEWDSGQAEYPQEPVHRLFERWASTKPHAPAAHFEDQTLSYEELNSKSNQLAHHLISCGVKPGDAVAVCVTPSLEIVVSFLAIWKVAAVYVPLDPTHPEALLAAILEEVKPRLVLTDSKLRSLTGPEAHAQFCFDTHGGSLSRLPTVGPITNGTLEDRAYVLYTSGTTGKPKGVDARHSNLAHYVHVAQQQYNFGPHDSFCSLARYTFSISLFELVLPLACGASVRLLVRDDVLAPNRLAAVLNEVTVVHAGPSLLGNLFRYLRSNALGNRTFPRIRHASSGGDLVPPTVIEEMKLVFENAELYVIYGCTEISCMGCTYPIPRDQTVSRTFVGKPFPDVAVRIVDPAGNIVPFGTVGEIIFAGRGVVRGYLDRPELNAEKFIQREGRCYYQTGDMGRLHPDGNVEILGRRDYQVQLRGIRVELPGIENKVREIGLAEQCATVVKKLHDHDVRLIAFVVKPREATISNFRRVLAAHLPDYMLPQGLVVIDALPLTRNGKLDRNALQDLPWENPDQETSPAQPGTTIERQVAAAFAKALGIPQVGLDDNFFDRGGHSLLAVLMLQELENTLGLSLSPGLLFEFPTVRGLAAQALGTMVSVPKPILLSRYADKPPIYLLLGVQIYRPLAKRLEELYTVYGVYAGRELMMLGAADQVPTVPELARDYVEIIRRHQPEGPYSLAGISFGGIVAYEVGRQLREIGADVAYVGLIDAILPESGLSYRIGQLKRLVRLPWREMFRIGTKRLASLFAGRGKSEFIRYDADAQIAPVEELRQEAYARAALEYLAHIQPWDGNIDLIVAGRRLARDPLQPPDCGWRSRIDTVRVHHCDSEHLGLVEEPHVAELAQIFHDSLSRTRTSASPAAAGGSPAGPRRKPTNDLFEQATWRLGSR